VKDAIRREGEVKLSRVPRHHIERLAWARLFEDGEYRARLIADAKLIVEQWTAEGFFGKRAAQAAHNLRHTVRSESLCCRDFRVTQLTHIMERRDDSRLRTG
jgi:hypothetical protein